MNEQFMPTETPLALKLEKFEIGEAPGLDPQEIYGRFAEIMGKLLALGPARKD